MLSQDRVTSPRFHVAGQRIQLRSPCKADIPTLLAMRNDVGLQRMLLADPRPNSVEDVECWVHRRGADSGSFFAIIAQTADDRCVGFVQVVGRQPPHQVGSLGIAIQHEFSGRGYATEAISVTESHLADRGLRKMVLEVRGDNTKAISLYERLGYRWVGVHRRHYVAAHQEFDVVLMEKFVDSKRSWPVSRDH